MAVRECVHVPVPSARGCKIESDWVDGVVCVLLLFYFVDVPAA